MVDNVKNIVFVLVIPLFFLAITRIGYSDTLDDPIAYGAWLYQGKCVRCHGKYKDARVAESFDSEKELAKGIGEGRCQIRWSRMKGGSLGSKEIRALACYMIIWEKNDQEPSLPKLPPQPEKKVALSQKKTNRVKTVEQPMKGNLTLSMPLLSLMKRQPAAHGGWLYTNNCYRCHLSYKQARMGQGMSQEFIRSTITEGKTSTQMKPFSRMLGGNLKNNEISDIVQYITLWEQKKEELALAPQLLSPPTVDPGELKPVRLPRFKKITGNRVNGKRLYRCKCLSCHGKYLEGNIGYALKTDNMGIRPDLYIKSVLKQGIKGSLMQSWLQSRKDPFSAKDIDDLVHYIITTSSKK